MSLSVWQAKVQQAKQGQKWAMRGCVQAWYDTCSHLHECVCLQAVADMQQVKQDEEWAMRERARQKLMAEVDTIRQEQIRAKQARQLALMEEEMRYKMQIDQVRAGWRCDYDCVCVRVCGCMCLCAVCLAGDGDKDALHSADPPGGSSVQHVRSYMLFLCVTLCVCACVCERVPVVCTTCVCLCVCMCVGVWVSCC